MLRDKFSSRRDGVVRDVYYRYIGNVTLHMYFEANMIGKSGRIVIEIDPETKQQLYSMLALNGLNLKEWFLNNADAVHRSKRSASIIAVRTGASK